MQQQGDEKDNFTRIGLAVLDEVQDAVRIVVDANIPNSLEDIFNNQQHKIYHYFSKECCFKCHNKDPLFRNKTILTRTQMEIVYTKSTIHLQQEKLDFCCSTAIPGIESKQFDLSFLHAFLKMFPKFIYWPSCLSNQNKSVADLLNDNKHKLYHLYDKNPCCYCLPGQQQSTDEFTISKHEFQILFKNQSSVSCKNTGSVGVCICPFSANNLREELLWDRLTNAVLRTCSSLKKCMDALVEIRNKVYAHARNSKMSNKDFKNTWKLIEEKVPELLNHGIFDEKGRKQAIQDFTQRLEDLKVKPLTEELHRQVVTNLLQQNVNMTELHEIVQAGFVNLQSVAENTEAGVWNLQSVPGNVEELKILVTKLPGLVLEMLNKQADKRQERHDLNTKPDLDTDTVPEDEPGNQDRNTNSDLDYDAEPYLAEEEPLNQGAEAVERRDERSVDRKEQTYIKTGVTGSDQTFRQDQTVVSDLDVDAIPYVTDNESISQGVSGGGELIGEQKDNLACATGSQNKQDGYKYDILILHSQYDEGHIDEMKRIIIEKVDLPDVKIASTEDDIPAGANLFAAFNELMDVSRSLLLFITPKFYDDCLSRFRMHTQLVRHYEDGDCVIPVLFGEDKIRKDLREIGHLKPVIFFKEEDGDKCKAFIKTITTTLQHCRDFRK